MEKQLTRGCSIAMVVLILIGLIIDFLNGALP
jgi:hypothetical protein